MIHRGGFTSHSRDDLLLVAAANEPPRHQGPGAGNREDLKRQFSVMRRSAAL